MKEEGPIDNLFRQALDEQDYGAQMHLWPGVANRLPKPFLSARRICLWALLAFSFHILPGERYEDGSGSGIKASNNTFSAPVANLTDPSPLHEGPEKDPRLAKQSTGNIALPSLRDDSNAADRTPNPSARDKKTATRLRNNIRENQRGQGISAQQNGQQQVMLPEEGYAENTTGPGSFPSESEARRSAGPGIGSIPMRTTPFSPYPLEDVIPPIKFLGERWFAALDLSVSQDWLQRNLYARNSAYEPYAQLRNTTESPRSANTASLRLSLIAASGITLRGGIQIAQIHETFAHSTEVRETQFIPRRDANGNLIGTDTVFRIVPVSYAQHNRFHTVDIPLTIGFQFPLGKAHFGIHAGPVLNMAFYQRGKFLAEDGEQVVDFSSSTPDAYPAFRNRLGMGFYGSINLSVPVTPSVHFFAEPYLRVYPGSFTNNDYPIDQRYRTQGIFLGIRKVLGPYWMNLRP